MMERKDIIKWLKDKKGKLLEEQSKLHDITDKCANCKACEESELPVLFCGGHASRIDETGYKIALIDELMTRI